MLPVSEIKLPEESLLVSIRRGRKLRVTHGYTVLQGRDRVTIFANQADIPVVRQILTGVEERGSVIVQHRARHREIMLPPGAACSGKIVRDLSLPPECILVSIQRQNRVIIPHGDTVLHAGDMIEIFGVETDLNQAEQCLC